MAVHRLRTIADYGYIYYRVFIKENIHILYESMAITAIAEEIIKGLTPMVFEQSQVPQRQEHGDSLRGFFFSFTEISLK